MKKFTTLTAVFFALFLVLSTTVSASAPVTVGWQIGKSDGAVNPINGSLEYPANEIFVSSFDYTVGTDADPINSPSMFGYLGPANVCDFADDGRPCTDTTAELNISFDLAGNLNNVTLVYDRYGSEKDSLWLDDGQFGTAQATEGGFQHFAFSLGSLDAGSHIITILYEGGGSNSGHYIDYLALTSDGTCGVNIDIKPGSYPNSFNVDGNGVVPVAILGSETFDVTLIDQDTLSFAGLDVSVKGNGSPQCAVEDVSGANMPDGEPDGYPDLVCQFEDDTSTWSPDDGTAKVSGYLVDGTYFEGSDEINLVQ